MRLFLLLVFNTLILLKNLDFGFADEASMVDGDRQVLLALKSQVSENKRVVLASWNHSIPLCEWAHVTCGRKHKRVTSLDLGGLQLGGIILPSLGNLSFLKVLNLGDNSFGGTIPKELGMLFRLQQLNMSYNSLEGEIPSLSNCSRLVTLDLMSNRLIHGLPSGLGSLSSLEKLLLSKNNLSGKFPTSLGNLTSLSQFAIAYNHMEGEVPDNIGRLTHMISVQLSQNNLSGVFPPAIYNLSSLRFLSIVGNHFSGNLRPDFGNMLTTIKELYLGMNSFSGNLPKTISNISTLTHLEISQNLFTGSIPVGFGALHNIKMLGLNENSFGNNFVGDLDFLSALVNCTQLRVLDFGYNRLGGKLPIFVANLSIELAAMYMGGNLISGGIPHAIGNLINLQALGMETNLLTGRIPTSLGKIIGLKELGLNSNRMSGEIPSNLGNITRLESLNLFNNSFEGSIPPSLGKCRFLLFLRIGSNKLNGIIPQEIMQMESLVGFYISRNLLTGPFPKDVGRLNNLVVLSAANNRFHGNIPETLGNCLSMEEIYLGGNGFDGAIPDIRNLRALRIFSLSKNNLSGSIPEYLANFPSLQYLNLSVNNLEGIVPTKGVFQTPEKFSVSGNGKLCGGIPKLKKKKDGAKTADNLLSKSPFYERISYEELRSATCEFSSSNLIGSGNFSSVFKGLLGPESKVAAVKVLNLQKHGAAKSFMAECEALKSIRHRNLVKLVTACSSIDFKGNEFKALVYEFMPNGNLDTWLHPDEVGSSENHPRPLKLCERLNIAIDVASVLDYIHSHCHDPVAHCDLKPSNVLLDNDLTAHVSDFGLARIVDQESFINQLSSTGVRGTIGYAAPEYGMGGKPSRQGDVYSFGVLMLEMFTGKRPTDQLFIGDLTLRSYVDSGLPEHVLDMADILILHGEVRNNNINIAECLKMVFHVGIRCCEESPINRMTMAEALAELVSLRKRFFKTKRTTFRAGR
ncbi:Leucine-rich repeat [Arabidopsis thaliana x Arabidopsis arenosa]|uniref:non-specific serine/threonine protein kinase n=1 Tax=Arabidopsis thaliana x Arabidopsis arenosa TaxID=1240361 RepID=A0A8T1XPI8_9BRAS|nr:Leucine-rich repeat [Arabidopsis thaliana x Arabidopsis arenosa]